MNQTYKMLFLTISPNDMLYLITKHRESFPAFTKVDLTKVHLILQIYMIQGFVLDWCHCMVIVMYFYRIHTLTSSGAVDHGFDLRSDHTIDHRYLLLLR